MATTRSRPRRRTPPRSPSHKRPSAQSLTRRLARLTAERSADAERHARALSALRRAHDRRVAALVQEIAQLRHHEARNQALTRLLAERDAALDARARRILELESLLQRATEIR
jgi:hypothetical protein